MRCQRGSFFQLLKGYIVKGQMLIPSSQITILKFKINASKKMKMYQDIIKIHPKYRIENLLSPYDRLSRFFDKES